jgi:hypothetical protein
MSPLIFASRYHTCSCLPDVFEYFRTAVVVTHIDRAVTRTVERQQMRDAAAKRQRCLSTRAKLKVAIMVIRSLDSVQEVEAC